MGCQSGSLTPLSCPLPLLPFLASPVPPHHSHPSLLCLWKAKGWWYPVLARLQRVGVLCMTSHTVLLFSEPQGRCDGLGHRPWPLI